MEGFLHGNGGVGGSLQGVIDALGAFWVFACLGFFFFPCFFARLFWSEDFWWVLFFFHEIFYLPTNFCIYFLFTRLLNFSSHLPKICH